MRPSQVWLIQPSLHLAATALGYTQWGLCCVWIFAGCNKTCRRHRRCIGQSFYHHNRHDHLRRLEQPRRSVSGWNSQAAMCGKPAATANRHLHRICVCMHQPSANAYVDRLKQRVRPLHSGVSVCIYDRLEQPDRIHEQLYDIFATTSRRVSNNHVVNTT